MKEYSVYIPKESFEANPRANLIRIRSLQAGHVIDALNHNAVLRSNDNGISKAELRLKAIREEFDGLGIKADLHVGRPLAHILVDSVVGAEYIAGQLYPFLSASSSQLSEFKQADLFVSFVYKFLDYYPKGEDSDSRLPRFSRGE